MIQTQCPYCKRVFKVADTDLDRQAKCKCKQIFTVAEYKGDIKQAKKNVEYKSFHSTFWIALLGIFGGFLIWQLLFFCLYKFLDRSPAWWSVPASAEISEWEEEGGNNDYPIKEPETYTDKIVSTKAFNKYIEGDNPLINLTLTVEENVTRKYIWYNINANIYNKTSYKFSEIGIEISAYYRDNGIRISNGTRYAIINPNYDRDKVDIFSQHVASDTPFDNIDQYEYHRIYKAKILYVITEKNYFGYYRVFTSNNREAKEIKSLFDYHCGL